MNKVVANADEAIGDVFDGATIMLGVDQQPIVSGVRELLGDGWTVSVEEQAHFGLSGSQLLLEF